MLFAKRVFLTAGIVGLLMLLPQYFIEDRIGVDQPPPITHPEFFYGFIGVAVAWQIAFLIIAGDPVRYRPLMAAAVVEKLTFGIATLVLFAGGRTAVVVAACGTLDLVWAALFIAAFIRTR